MLCKSVIPSRITRLYCLFFVLRGIETSCRSQGIPHASYRLRIRSLKPAGKPTSIPTAAGFSSSLSQHQQALAHGLSLRRQKQAPQFRGLSCRISQGCQSAPEARRLLAKGIDSSAYKRRQQEAWWGYCFPSFIDGMSIVRLDVLDCSRRLAASTAAVRASLTLLSTQ